MSSSLIYVAIVVMWACLLIPMWLRRHEQETEVRSVDRFSTAMRILSRRTPPAADSRYLVMPRRPAAATKPVAEIPTPRARTAVPAAAARRRGGRPGHTGRSRLIARRRRVLVGLVGLAALLFIVSIAGGGLWWWQLVADLAVVAFAAHLRAEAKRARELDRRRRARERRGIAVPAQASARTAEVAGMPTAEPAPAMETAAVVDDGTWEPVPVPVPTYVTAPVAPRAEPPLIDLTRPGEWTAAHAHATPGFLADDDDELFDQMVDDDSLDAIVERRRAVGD